MISLKLINKKYSIILILHGSSKKIWKRKFIKYNNIIKSKLFFLNNISNNYLNNINNPVIKNINKNNKKYINYIIIPIFISKGKHILIDIKNIIKNYLKIFSFIKIFYIKKKLKIKEFIINLVKNF